MPCDVTLSATPLAARLLLLAAVLAAAGAVGYTILYIRRIKRRQRETLAAYLDLLNRPAAAAHGNGGSAGPEQAPKKVSAEDDRMMKAITLFVEQHIADSDINIGDMAVAAATSRSGLQRKMKQMLGVTPLDFLREARIKRACTLLRGGGMTVSEVAFACGFSDPKYFSRCFKASVGKSPTEYRGRDACLRPCGIEMLNNVVILRLLVAHIGFLSIFENNSD